MCVSVYTPSFLNGYDEKPAVIHSRLTVYFTSIIYARVACQLTGVAINPPFSAQVLYGIESQAVGLPNE